MFSKYLVCIGPFEERSNSKLKVAQKQEKFKKLNKLYYLNILYYLNNFIIKHTLLFKLSRQGWYTGYTTKEKKQLKGD